MERGADKFCHRRAFNSRGGNAAFDEEGAVWYNSFVISRAICLNQEHVMNPEFEQTVNSLARFKTYSLSLILLNKAAQAIQERGADREAVQLILRGIQLLNKQLSEAVEVLQRRQQVERFIAKLNNDWEVDGNGNRREP
jgi:hypothetical protein